MGIIVTKRQPVQFFTDGPAHGQGDVLGNAGHDILFKKTEQGAEQVKHCDHPYDLTHGGHVDLEGGALGYGILYAVINLVDGLADQGRRDDIKHGGGYDAENHCQYLGSLFHQIPEKTFCRAFDILGPVSRHFIPKQFNGTLAFQDVFFLTHADSS